MKRTLTLNLPEREDDVLEQMAKEKDMSKTAVLRQALRLYQLVDLRLKDGHRMAFIDESGNVMRTDVIGLGELQ